MLRRRISLVLFTFVFLVAAKQRAVRHPAGWPLTEAPKDTFSQSQPAQVTTEHISLDLTVDFEQRRLRGTATLDIENLTGTNTLTLDTWQLDVTSVTLDGGTPATWSYGTTTPFSRPMNITIGANTDLVTIAYSTSSTAPGLYWNTAAQSFGRVQPYLYTLNEPVQARTWIPSQDTPTVRLTYDATIRVPRGMLALMSANDNATAANDTGVYTFRMNYHIPIYLVALAVGRLEFRALSDRTGVYAEPELIEDAAWELQYMPRMMTAAEEIAGPFPFSRHDVLFMPPTFIVGGMEHPMLNFVSPAIITGNHPPDPLPSTLIAHELAHSWAGDSTTLANWNDVWLNEGITSYLTHRIIEKMSGVERAELGWVNDRANYTNYAQSATTATILHRNVTHPSEGFGATGYTKGALFIKTLEDRIGRPTFDRFLRRYFQTFAFRWVDHENFLAFLRHEALTGNPALEAQLRLDEWLYHAGLPSNLTAPTSSTLLMRVQQRAQAFAGGTHITALAPQTWTQLELEQFLIHAPQQAVRSRMAELDAAFGLSARNLPPSSWLMHTIHAQYQPGMAAVERALMRGGSNSSIVNLYRALEAVNRAKAIEIFNRARDRYDDDVEAEVLSILGLSQALFEKAVA
jgi:leukotriene-A4 hydrolase